MDRLIDLIINTKKSLIITPSSYHVPIMLRLNKEEALFDVKYCTKENFITDNSFKLKDTALAQMSSALKLSPTVLSEIIQYLPYLNDEVSQDLELFVTVQQYIKDNNLMEDSISFQEKYRNRKIYIYGYPALDRLFLRYLDSLGSDFPYEIINLKEVEGKIPFIMFNSEYEEVEYLCNIISEKIANGIDINHIKVHCTSPSYVPVISTLFNRFNLNPYFSANSNLASLNITSKVLQMIDESTKSIEETLQDIYGLLQRTLAYQSEQSNALFIQYIGTLNKYILFDGLLKDYKTIIEYDLSKTSVKNIRSKSSVFIGDLSNEFCEELDTLYVLGFNEGDVPKVAKNNKILDNSMLLRIGAETSTESTSLSKLEYKSLIKSNNVAYVSYATHSLTSEKIISTLSIELKEMGLLYDSEAMSFKNHYSIQHDIITLAKMISETKEYGLLTKDLDVYANSVLKHGKYPSKFKQKSGNLDPDLIPIILSDLHSLSYSTINDYFKCNFKFLLKKVLKVPENYGEKLPAMIGDLFHKTLQRITECPSDSNLKDAFFRQVLDELIREKEYELSNKEYFYLTHSFEQLNLVVEWIKGIHLKTEYSALYNEKEYIIPLKGSFITEFKGVIDVVMALDDNFFIMDYKTGYASIDISNLEFGIESQLVFYLYLVDQGEEELMKPSGFFYSPIYTKRMNAVAGKTYEELLLDSWKLNGFVSEANLSKIDPDYAEESFIKGIKTKKNSTVLRKGAKTLSTPNQNKLIKHIKDLLEKAIVDIEIGVFDVNPKGSLLESESCSYCEYKDICFKSEANFTKKTSKDKQSLEFLKGGE